MIKEKYINFVLLLAVISSSIIIPEQLLGRNIFYIYSSVVIIGSFYFKKLTITRQDLMLGAAIFLIGASQLLWSGSFLHILRRSIALILIIPKRVLI